MDPRRCRFVSGTGLGALGALTVALPRVPLSIEQVATFVPLRCPLHFWTGIECPTCGLGRGLLAALAGDLAAAWSYHLLAVPVLFFLVTALVLGLILPSRGTSGALEQ